MDNGGPTVTVHIDQEFKRAYRRALARDRRARWMWLSAYLAIFGAFVVWDHSYGWSWATFFGFLAYSEVKALRCDSDVPVGHDLVAEYGDVSLVIRRPDRTAGRAPLRQGPPLGQGPPQVAETVGPTAERGRTRVSRQCFVTTTACVCTAR